MNNISVIVNQINKNISISQFSSTWKGRAIIAGIILLASTLIQLIVWLIARHFNRKKACQNARVVLPKRIEVLHRQQQEQPILNATKVVPSLNFNVPPLEQPSKGKDRDDTDILLATPGFEREGAEALDPRRGYRGEVQGTSALRKMAAKITKKNIHALSLENLNSHRVDNFEQNAIFKIKRFTHVNELKGQTKLPSGKMVNFEGFCEAYTILMLASSFDGFARQKTFFDEASTRWIIEKLTQIHTSDRVKDKTIDGIYTATQGQNFSDFIGFGSGYDWHSTATFLMEGDLLVHINRGNGSGAFSGITIHQIDRSLLSKDLVTKWARRQNIPIMNALDMVSITAGLKGSLEHYEPMTLQGVGNCTYKTMQSTLFFLMAARHRLNNQNTLSWKESFKAVSDYYEQFIQYDKEAVTEDFIAEAEEIQKKTHPHASVALGVAYSIPLTAWKLTSGKHPSKQKVNELISDLRALPFQK